MHGRFFLFLIFSCSLACTQPPPPRHLEEIAFDKSRNRLLLFGGVELGEGKFVEPSNLHEWDGSIWKRTEATGPIGRRGGAWVYDEAEKKTFLIGGAATGKAVEDSVLFDVWSWNGTAWQQLPSECPVKEPEAVYDPVEGRILVYGEVSNKAAINYDGEHLFELWHYKDNNWKKLSTNGPNIIGSRMIAFDSDRKTLVVPVFQNEGLFVWEWSGGEWKKTVCGESCPAYRTRFALGYHPIDKATFLFGGLTADREKQLGDFWKWNGSKWQEVKTSGSPLARNSAHFVFGNGGLMLYGGSIPKPAPQKGLQLSNELWIWKNSAWTQMKQ
jgi:hypothetical protein